MARRKTKTVTVKSKTPSGDPVSFQIAITMHRPSNVKLTKELLRDMIRHKAETSAGTYEHKTGTVRGAREGRDPVGVTMKITRWRNPARKGAADNRTYRSHGSQADRWGSLRLAIAGARITVK